MNKTIRYSIYGVLGVLLLYVFACHKEKPLITGELGTENTARVAVKNRVLAVQTKEGIKTTYVPQNGHAAVTIKEDGRAVIDVKHVGLSFVPVVGFLVTDKLNVAGGVQLVYWNRTELYGGIIGPNIAAFVGLGYRLDRIKLSNTSLFVGYTTRKDVGAGLLVRF